LSELSYQRGNPVFLNNHLKVHPLTLSEIEAMGEHQYYSLINILSISKDTIMNMYPFSSDELEIFKPLSVFEVMVGFLDSNNMLRDLVLGSLSLFLQEKVLFDIENKIHVFKNSTLIKIDEITFKEIRKIVLKQNFMDADTDKKELNPENDKAKELIEKMKQVKEKIQKQNNDEGLNLSDIISIVANYSKDINILSVWNLTVYQLYESYIRISMWDKYHNDYIHLPYMDENDRKELNKNHWHNKVKK
jgi:hypothetical protein